MWSVKGQRRMKPLYRDIWRISFVGRDRSLRSDLTREWRQCRAGFPCGKGQGAWQGPQLQQLSRSQLSIVIHVLSIRTSIDQVDNATDPAGLADHAHLFPASSGARPVHCQSWAFGLVLWDKGTWVRIPRSRRIGAGRSARTVLCVAIDGMISRHFTSWRSNEEAIAGSSCSLWAQADKTVYRPSYWNIICSWWCQVWKRPTVVIWKLKPQSFDNVSGRCGFVDLALE